MLRLRDYRPARKTFAGRAMSLVESCAGCNVNPMLKTLLAAPHSKLILGG
jgi:hypothetical protein